MRGKLLERRSRLLTLRGMGISLSNAVKELAPQYRVSTRAIYLDWANRKEWLDDLVDIKDPKTLFMEILHSNGDLKQRATSEYAHAETCMARINALRLLRDLNHDLLEMIVTKDIEERIAKLEEGQSPGETTP